MKIQRRVQNMQFGTSPEEQTLATITLTDAEIEEAYTEFLKQKFIRDVKYFLDENYEGDPDEETIESIAEDYKESLGDRVGQLESEVFDDVMELNYPEYERNY